MKIRKGFIVRRVGGQNVAVATGEMSKSFKGMIKLNESGKLLWDALAAGADEDALVAKLLEEYEIDEATARADARGFISKLEEVGALES